MEESRLKKLRFWLSKKKNQEGKENYGKGGPLGKQRPTLNVPRAYTMVGKYPSRLRKSQGEMKKGRPLPEVGGKKRNAGKKKKISREPGPPSLLGTEKGSK